MEEIRLRGVRRSGGVGGIVTRMYGMREEARGCGCAQ